MDFSKEIGLVVEQVVNMPEQCQGFRVEFDDDRAGRDDGGGSLFGRTRCDRWVRSSISPTHAASLP